ncbi:MAG: response regulator, partial [Thermodesulfovibrionales bacterium]|nr:response regulator [Thermodesulfovibrionales bacterium]
MKDLDKSYKILVADYEKATRDYFYMILSSYGYICYTTDDGNEAISLAKAEKPDIIFLDLFLLKVSGFEVCKKLKSDSETYSIPIIIVTKANEHDLKIRCLESGANDFILKPIDPLEIKIKAQNYINLKKYNEIETKNLLLSQTIKLVEKAKKEWESIVDCLNDIIVLVDQQNIILRINKRLSELMETDFSNILGKRFQDVLKEGFFTYEISDSGDIELYHVSGRYFNYNIYYIRDFNQSNKTVAVIVLQDITNIKRLTKKLENSKKMLENKHSELKKAYSELKSAQSQIIQQEKMASIGQLAAGITHEINNPTGYIMSNLNTL